MAEISPVYQPRNPQTSQYYQCIEDHFETLEQVYDERFAEQYGFFRAYVKRVIYRKNWARLIRPEILTLLTSHLFYLFSGIAPSTIWRMSFILDTQG